MCEFNCLRKCCSTVWRVCPWLWRSCVFVPRRRAAERRRSRDLQRRAISVLQAAMKESKDKDKDFEKVHAAEALIWTGHPEGVREYFLAEDRAAGSESRYRIGIWRALYRSNAGDPAVQKKYLQKILAVFSDPKAEDRETAGETLGKLRYAGAATSPWRAIWRRTARAASRSRPDGFWPTPARPKTKPIWRNLCGRKIRKTAYYAAYAIRFLPTIRPATLKMCQDLAAVEPADGEVRYYALGALYTHLPADQRESVKRELLKYAATGNTDQRYEACIALANWPTADMIPVVEKLLDNKPSDERVGAAYVLLKMGRPRDEMDPNH